MYALSADNDKLDAGFSKYVGKKAMEGKTSMLSPVKDNQSEKNLDESVELLDIEAISKDAALENLSKETAVFPTLIQQDDTTSIVDKTYTEDPKPNGTAQRSGFSISENLDFGKAGHVESVARNLDLSQGPKYEVPVYREDNSNPVQDNFVATGFIIPPIINIDPVDPEPPFIAQNDLYALNKVGDKRLIESPFTIGFDQLPEGKILAPQALLEHAMITDVQNFGGGPDIATLINSNNNQNGVQNLQSPWHRGNIKAEASGNLLVISDGDVDQNQDGILDMPRPQSTTPPTGQISFNFDSPVYEFGFDIFNLEYGPEMQAAEITFYDKDGRSTIVPFESFLDPLSPFYDSSLQFGARSANRIQPIAVTDLALSEIVEAKITLSDSVGIANFKIVEQNIELLPNTLVGNVFENDHLGAPHVAAQAAITEIRFTFKNNQDAQNFLANHPQLSATVHHSQIKISDLNQTIPTPLDGFLNLQSDGNFHYTASDDFTIGQKQEVFDYTVSSGGKSASARVRINLNDNLPLANDNENYINSGKGIHQYNLVLILDISGSMDASIYNHSRLEMAQDALIQLIDQYELMADELHITIVPFASSDGLEGAFSYTATSAQDARDYVLKHNAHAQDGIQIQMVNPDTGNALGRATHYDSALYHARVALEADIVDPSMEHFEHIVYFISDGVPNNSHTATDQAAWPQSWGSWQDFIQDTKTQVPNAFVESINVFAVGIDPDESLRAPLEPIASDNDHIIEPDAKLFTFSQKLLETLPDAIIGNVLDNDLFYSQDAKVNKISFIVQDASGFISTHHLDLMGAVASTHNDSISILLPIDGDYITVPTPLGGKLLLDNDGYYLYAPAKVTQESTESFTYTLFDDVVNQTSEADLNIHLYPGMSTVSRMIGDHVGDVLSSENQSGIIYMEGGRGDDQFIIDLNNQAVPLVFIRDLTNGDNNQLSFKNVIDKNNDGVINLSDVFLDFRQEQENADLKILLNNANSANHFAGTELILENMGTVPGHSVANLIDYFDSISLSISIS